MSGHRSIDEDDHEGDDDKDFADEFFDDSGHESGFEAEPAPDPELPERLRLLKWAREHGLHPDTPGIERIGRRLGWFLGWGMLADAAIVIAALAMLDPTGFLKLLSLPQGPFAEALVRYLVGDTALGAAVFFAWMALVALFAPIRAMRASREKARKIAFYIVGAFAVFGLMLTVAVVRKISTGEASG